MSAPGRPVLRAISPEATSEEVAVILAAIEECNRLNALSAHASVESRDAWVYASRLTARGAPFDRGPWRLSGRIARRPGP